MEGQASDSSIGGMSGGQGWAAAGGPGRADEVEVQVIGAGGALAGSARGARGGGEDGGRGDRGGTAAVLSWASAVRAVSRQITSFFPRRRNRVSSIATATGVPAGVSSAITQAGGSQAQVSASPHVSCPPRRGSLV